MSLTGNILMKVIEKIRVNFGDLYVQNNLVVVRLKIELH